MNDERLLIGTNNQDKLNELKRLVGKALRVQSLKDFPGSTEAVEDGTTFISNAKKKASHYAKYTGQLTLADDSGLMVNALNGAPGVYSARYAGEGCTYRDNNEKLLRVLKKKRSRAAKFVCVIAVYDGRKFIGSVRGECKGKIAEKIRGKNGFGYDPVFIPVGYTKTFAELPPAVKNKVSHRSRALRAAVKLVRRYLATA